MRLLLSVLALTRIYAKNISNNESYEHNIHTHTHTIFVRRITKSMSNLFGFCWILFSITFSFPFIQFMCFFSSLVFQNLHSLATALKITNRYFSCKALLNTYMLLLLLFNSLLFWINVRIANELNCCVILILF